MWKRLLWGFALVLTSAWAMASPLDDARQAGQIKELPTGYVQAAPSSPARIKALAADVNKRRREAYERIAEKNGLSVRQVAIESYKKRHGS